MAYTNLINRKNFKVIKLRRMAYLHMPIPIYDFKLSFIESLFIYHEGYWGECTVIPTIHNFTMHDCLNILHNYKIEKKISLNSSLQWAFDQIEYSKNNKINDNYINSYLLEHLEVVNSDNIKIKMSNITKTDFLSWYQKQIIKFSNSKLQIRVDFNGKLSIMEFIDWEKFFIKNTIPIEYIEDPVSEISHWKSLTNTQLPLSFDKNATKFINSIANIDSIKYITIKPLIFNGIKEFKGFLQSVRNMKKIPIFSSCFETPYSHSIYNSVAISLGNNNLAHGFDTEKYFMLKLY